MEEIRILETIRDNSDINIACIVEKDETVNKNYVKALERTERELAQKPEGQFFRGALDDHCFSHNPPCPRSMLVGNAAVRLIT